MMTRTQLSALCLCALLVGCVPPKPSAEIIEYSVGDPPYAIVQADQVSGEVRVVAEVAAPSVCEGDSTHLQARLEVVGMPTQVEFEGIAWLAIREDHLNGMTEIAMFRLSSPTTLELAVMVILPNVPCTVKQVFGRYQLEQQ